MSDFSHGSCHNPPCTKFQVARVGVSLTRDPIINKILSMKRHFIKTTEVTTNPRRSQVMWEKTEKIEIFFANFFQKKIAILVLSIVLSIVLSVTQFYISQFWLKKISQFFVSQFCVSQFWYLVSFFANFVKYYLCLKLRWNRKARTASRWEQESLRLWLRSDAFGRCSVSRCFENKVASQVPDEGKIERFQHHFFL